MTKAGDLPPGNPVARQHGRQYQVHDVRLGGAETARRGDDRHFIAISQKKKITRFYGRKKALQMATDSGHGPADDFSRVIDAFCTRERHPRLRCGQIVQVVDLAVLPEGGVSIEEAGADA